MTDRDRLERALRQAFPATAAVAPSRDLWPAVLRRSQPRIRWSWLDVSMAAAVAIALWFSPAWLWLVVYYL
jgi:hypothetical protein